MHRVKSEVADRAFRLVEPLDLPDLDVQWQRDNWTHPWNALHEAHFADLLANRLDPILRNAHPRIQGIYHGVQSRKMRKRLKHMTASLLRVDVGFPLLVPGLAGLKVAPDERGLDVVVDPDAWRLEEFVLPHRVAYRAKLGRGHVDLFKFPCPVFLREPRRIVVRLLARAAFAGGRGSRRRC